MKYIIPLLTGLLALGANKAFASDNLQPGLMAEYFDIGSSLDDFPKLAADKKPTVARVDKTIDFDVGEDVWPGTKLQDYFYARWTGSLRVPKDGKYTFFLESDDGSRLFIDGKQVVDNNGIHAMEEKSGEVELKAGDHPIKVEFFENDGNAGCKFSWQGPDIAKQIVPEKVLFHAGDAPAPAPAPAPAEKSDAKSGLMAEYFDIGSSLDDFPKIAADKKPTVTRVDKTIDFDVGEDVWPGTKLQDYFYARWTGSLRVPKDGKYTFFLESDDGSRLFVDGKQVVDNNGLHPMEEKSGEVELKAGDHPIKVEFFENDGNAGCKFSWQGPDIAKQIVPEKVLSH